MARSSRQLQKGRSFEAVDFTCCDAMPVRHGCLLYSGTEPFGYKVVCLYLCINCMGCYDLHSSPACQRHNTLIAHSGKDWK